MKKVFLAFILLVGFVCPDLSYAVIWDSAGYEGAAGNHNTPASTDSPADTPDFLRGHRQTWQYRMSPEHFVGDSDVLADDNGLHRVGSGRCYVQAVAPTALTDSHLAPLNVNLADHDNSGNVAFGGEAGLDNPATNSAATDEDDVGHGRCWIDTDGLDGTVGTSDDFTMNTYIGIAGVGGAGGGWTRVHSDVVVSPVAQNLIYNGSFEATDGDGDSAATGASAVPIGWTILNAPTSYDYVAAPAIDGDGLAVSITGSGATSGIEQTLFLKPDMTYKVIARARSTAAVTCTLDTNNAGGADMTAATTTSATSSTLTGTFTTHATLVDELTVRYYAAGAAEVCDLDHVAVYEVDADPVPQPGLVVFEATSTATTVCADDWTTCAGSVVGIDLVVVVDPPGPGYVAEVITSVGVDVDNAGSCEIRVHDGSTTIVNDGAWDDSGTPDTDGYLKASKYISTPMVPGTSVTFSTDIRARLVTCDLDPTGGHFTSVPHYLQVILHPTR